MSAGFWIRRKRAAAKKRNELLNATVVNNETVDTVTEKNTATDTAVEKPVKKAVRKNDNKGTDK